MVRVSKNILEEYSIQEDKRSARIIFKNNKFDKCFFTVVNDYYDLSDWLFIKKIADKISDIIREKLLSKVQ